MIGEQYFINKIDKEYEPIHGPNEDVYFTEQDYQQLQLNLVRYKDGSREATEYIIKVFHPFISKYAKFIKLGNLPYTTYTSKGGKVITRVSPTISSFVSLFIDKSVRKLPKEEKKKVFSLTCVKIKTLFDRYDYSDIYNELVLALLNMANKYKITHEGEIYHKKNGTFHMYVSKCFHWEAYRFLSKLIKDPLVHLNVLNLRDQFDDMDEDHQDEIFVKDDTTAKKIDRIITEESRRNDIKSTDKLTMKEPENLSAYDVNCLNFNWTSGVTCSELFECLTPYERELIVLSFIEEKTDIEIGKMYGSHRSTINEHKKRAVRKLQAQAIAMKNIKE